MEGIIRGLKACKEVFFLYIFKTFPIPSFPWIILNILRYYK